MDALFVGHAYIDITFLADELPTGDEKTIASDYAVAFGDGSLSTNGLARAPPNRARPFIRAGAGRSRGAAR